MASAKKRPARADDVGAAFLEQRAAKLPPSKKDEAEEHLRDAKRLRKSGRPGTALVTVEDKDEKD